MARTNGWAGEEPLMAALIITRSLGPDGLVSGPTSSKAEIVASRRLALRLVKEYGSEKTGAPGAAEANFNVGTSTFSLTARRGTKGFRLSAAARSSDAVCIRPIPNASDLNGRGSIPNPYGRRFRLTVHERAALGIVETIRESLLKQTAGRE